MEVRLAGYDETSVSGGCRLVVSLVFSFFFWRVGPSTPSYGSFEGRRRLAFFVSRGRRRAGGGREPGDDHTGTIRGTFPAQERKSTFLVCVFRLFPGWVVPSTSACRRPTESQFSSTSLCVVRQLCSFVLVRDRSPSLFSAARL